MKEEIYQTILKDKLLRARLAIALNRDVQTIRRYAQNRHAILTSIISLRAIKEHFEAQEITLEIF